MKKTKIRAKKRAPEIEDMELIRIKGKYQITLPQSLRSRIGLAVGDYIKAEVEDGKIILERIAMVPASDSGSGTGSKERQIAFAMIEEIWAKTKDEDPEEVEKLVREAVKAVRKSK